MYRLLPSLRIQTYILEKRLIGVNFHFLQKYKERKHQPICSIRTITVMDERGTDVATNTDTCQVISATPDGDTVNHDQQALMQIRVGGG